MDGTQAGFYYEPAAAGASEAARTGWVVHLQGGGECTDEALCSVQLSTKRGSSNYWDPYLWDLGFLASNNPAQSPNLSDWNHVFVPYCSQDLHSGQVTVPSDNTFGLYFAGHLSLAAVVESLKKQPAPAVVLPTLGGEAGSTGVGPAQSLANAMNGPEERVIARGRSCGGGGGGGGGGWGWRSQRGVYIERQQRAGGRAPRAPLPLLAACRARCSASGCLLWCIPSYIALYRPSNVIGH